MDFILDTIFHRDFRRDVQTHCSYQNTITIHDVNLNTDVTVRT
jgi:hypothetical protein